MKCPACGGAELAPDTRDLPYTYKGETTTIVAVRSCIPPSERPTRRRTTSARPGNSPSRPDRGAGTGPITASYRAWKKRRRASRTTPAAGS